MKNAQLSKSVNPADLKIPENQHQNVKPFSYSSCDSRSGNPDLKIHQKTSTKMKNHLATLNATLNLQILLI